MKVDCQFIKVRYFRTKEGGLVKALGCKMGVLSELLPDYCQDCSMKVTEDD